jgi:hypothetical protein
MCCPGNAAIPNDVRWAAVLALFLVAVTVASIPVISQNSDSRVLREGAVPAAEALARVAELPAE